MKFSVKLASVFFLILAAFAAAMYFFVYLPSLDSLESEIKGKFRREIVYLMSQVDRMLQERQTDLRLLSADAVLASPDSTPRQITSRLLDFRNRSTNYLSLSFFSLGRVRLADTSGLRIGEKHDWSPYWQNLNKGRSFTIDISESESLGEVVFHFAEVVRGSSGDPLGVIVARMPVSKLTSLIREAVSVGGIQPAVDLVREDGTLLYSNYNRPGILKDVLVEWQSVKKHLATYGRRIGWPRAALSSEEEYFFTFVQEDAFLGYEGKKWTLRAYIPRTVVFKPLVELRNKLLLLLVPLVLFAIAVVLFFSHTLSYPITQLKEAAAKLGRGEFDIPHRIRSRDEVGELAASFYQMADALKRSKAASEEWESALEKKVMERTRELREAQAESLRTLKDLRATKEALERSNEGLKKIDQLKSEFISTVSHEIRTPLSIIKEGTNLMLDRIPGGINDRQEQLLGLIKNNMLRLEHIINDLLDISRIEAGRLELKRDLTDMNLLVHQVVTMFEMKAKEKGIALRMDLPPGGVYVYVDAEKVGQVFMNLLGNAMKFTEKGHVSIAVKDDPEKVVCTVSDSGIGIAKQYLPQVFDKFQQFGRAPGPGEKGTGLGLSIAKGIVDMHHGQILVASEPGKGTAFTVTMPKPSFERVLQESIGRKFSELKDGEGRLSLIGIFISDFDKLSKRLEQTKLAQILKDLSALIKDGLRRAGDMPIRKEDRVLVVCVDCDRENAMKLMDRLSRKAGEFLADNRLSDILKLHFDCVSYPQDAKSVQALVRWAAGVPQVQGKR